MNKFVMYAKDIGLILQWQDHEEFNYADPDLETTCVKDVSDQDWEGKDIFTHVLGDKLVTYLDPPPEPQIITDTTVKENRRIAYADPVSGSDYFYIKTLFLQMSGFSNDSVEVQDALKSGSDRKLEIQKEHPYTNQ